MQMKEIKLSIDDLKPQTIKMLKDLYKKFPELIDYQIKFGNVYEKAQATLIKSVAIGDLQASDSLAAPDTCEALLDNTSKITQK